MPEERTEWFLEETARTYVPGQTRIPGSTFRSLLPLIDTPRSDFLVIEVGRAKRRWGHRGLWCRVKLREIT